MSEMYDNKNRTPFFKKDQSLETALDDLNGLIDTIEPSMNAGTSTEPIILIMGCPRSGTTLLLQWLAATGIFSYPSNLIARFYKNPYIGIRAQQALLELDPVNQLDFKEQELNFYSSLGKTIGALAPSEYWYFWRTYFKFNGESQILSKDELEAVNGSSFLKKLSAFNYLTNKPLVLKGMLLNWHIPYLYQINQNFIFINIERDSFFNAQSLLLAREKFFNDRDKWYSLKPQEYSFLKGLDPISQVAGQVIYTKRAIEKGLSEVPSNNVIDISYSDFCANPKNFLDDLLEKYKDFGGTVDSQNLNKKVISSFDVKNDIRLKPEEETYLRKKLSELELNST